MRKNHIKFWVVGILLVLSVFAVSANLSNNGIIPPSSFIKEGEVITLIQENENYYLKTENFASNGEYNYPAIERQLTYSEYALFRANKSYDIFEVRMQDTIKNKYLDVVQRYMPDGSPLLGNYIGEVLDGSFGPLEFADAKNYRTALIKDDGSFFIVTKHLDEDGNYTKDAVYKLISETQYMETLISQEFDYEQVIKFEVVDGLVIKSTEFFDVNGDMITRPIIIQMTGYSDLEEFLVDNGIEIPDETEKPDEGDSDKGDGDKTPSEPQKPWTGDSFTWNTSEPDKGTESKSWLDEWFVGEEDSNTWSDPFWDSFSSGESISGELVEEDGDEPIYGYVDDEGNFIATDENGNVLPSESGTFDEDGNFKPEDEDGYYDADGVFHPEKDEDDAFYDEDGNFYPNGEDGGYFDKDGNWHPADGSDVKLDENGNLILEDGTVVTPDGKVGYYDENGNFIEGENPYEDGYYDENGNFIMDDGTIIMADGTIIHPDGTVVLPDGTVGYYDENGNFIEGESPYEGGHFDADGNWISDDGTVKTGHLDENGNFILDDGSGYIDANGVFHPAGEDADFIIDENGNLVPKDVDGSLLIDEDGNLYVKGEEGYYDENGLVHLPDGRVGYYDENGNFIESDTNPNAVNDGFYDADGNWHDFNEAYEDKNGSTQLVDSPDIGLGVTEDGKGLTIEGQEGYYDENGLVHLPDGRVGYYDENGNFIESDTNPHKGGFYDANGDWIDDSLYAVDEDGNLSLTDGTFDKNGNYTTPNGDVGYFDENGNFIQGEENPYEDGFYDADGNWHEFGEVLVDENGNVIVTGEDGYYDENGNFISTESVAGVVDANGNFVDANGVVTTPDGKIGYYDENGNFIEGTNPYKDGYYDADGNFIKADGTVITPDGKVGYYDENGNFIEGENPYEDGYYDADGNFIKNDGTIIMADGTIINPDGTVISPDGKIGYYDENGNFIEGENPDKEGFYDSQGNYHKLGEDGYYDENGTFHSADGTIGYYDENGEWHEGTNPYSNGYYDKDGNWVGEGEPMVLVYDKDGNLVEVPASSISEGDGYYDSEGNYHLNDGSGTYIDANGNVHKKGEDSIGYIDGEGNFHLEGQDGYYDENGNYISPDGKVGYYDKNGNFIEGENPDKNGYYDADGNYHKFGDEGYYDANGVYHESVSDETTGYYNENGEFIEGSNPYINGHYDENGNWVGEGIPVKAYYDKDGNINYGENPYEGGYYDNEGNWHPNDEDGHYDKNGNFVDKDGNVGYYDKDGKFHKGTNPHVDGYYDKDGNWHPNGKDGYFKPDGTWVGADGSEGYYDKDGNFKNGKNPYEGGYYDSEGNWHPFGEDGYYDKDGVFHPNVIAVDKYNVNSENYILYEGFFRNPEDRKMYRLAGNTLQFTINKNLLNPIFIDTGFFIGQNALMEYDEVKDVLHNIAIQTNNKFISDVDSSILVYNGRIITVKRNETLSVNKVKSLFTNTNIEVKIQKSRIGGRFAFVEAVETKQDIKFTYDERTMKISKPLIVRDNRVLVPLSEFEQYIRYDVKVKDTRNEKRVTLSRQSKEFGDLSSELEFTTGNPTLYQKINGGKEEREMFTSPIIVELPTGEKEIYIPSKLLPMLTERNVYYDAMTYELSFEEE